ncbi:unnamed protein product [Prorocentrum cordatum]|uniref:Clathrin adaptor alpha/beta/gamma-adaptin appendage Ig-like subdomain domain-containing protein n=1 Tax=Prorocentrum cordatum TaxID=2364126 RepID=A0ABN9VQT0_9DINO|nr:unnamed protein product [Polarella glacialis]
MASILLEFEVLPEDAASEPAARDAAEDLQRQLADPLSSLRRGEFARYAAKASLTGPGLPEQPSPWEEEEEEVELPAVRTQASEPLAAVTLRASHGPMVLEVPDDDLERPAAARRDGGAWREAQALSNAELIDRISSLERLLASAEEKRAAEVASAARPAEEGVDTERLRALEQQCHRLQSRLDDVQREARAVRESSNTFRDRSEQLESRLRERESVLSHAKDMWVKESARAQKLEDALVSVEEKLLDHEGHLNRAVRRFDEAQQEVRQLSHLAGMPVGRRPEMLDPSSKGVPTGSFAGPAPGPGLAPRSGEPRPFDARFGGSTADPRLSSGGELKEAGALPQIAGTNAERLRRLCIVNDAVLYEDDVLQIGVKAQYAGEEGQVDVYFGNKSREALQAFAVYYHVPEERVLRLRAEQVEPQLGAGQQALQRVRVSLAGPFAEMPWLRAQFRLPDAGPRRVQASRGRQVHGRLRAVFERVLPYLALPGLR